MTHDAACDLLRAMDDAGLDVRPKALHSEGEGLLSVSGRHDVIDGFSRRIEAHSDALAALVSCRPPARPPLPTVDRIMSGR
jgi:hypothetical protein